MPPTIETTHKKIFVTACITLTVSALVVFLSVRTTSQQPNLPARNSVEEIAEAPDQPLRILENNDSPLRIIEAKVKEIPGFQFTTLTGRTTDLSSVSSVPQARLVNNSPQTVTGFILAIRDPKSKHSYGIVQNKVSIGPGETYVVAREDFIKTELLTTRESNGQIRQKSVRASMNSEKYWMTFASRSDLFVTVGQVSFKDGSVWQIKEGGEIR